MSLAEISSYLNDVSMDNLKAGCIIHMGSLLGCGSFCKTYTAWICYGDLLGYPISDCLYAD